VIELQDPSAGSDYTRGDEPSEELPEPTGPSAPSGPYEPGPLISPHIRRQLEQRRGRFAAAWRRDPARETALLALLILSLVAILAVGVALKESLFLRSGFDPEQSFWMESAQRFRYIREVAGGGAIPELDTQMQAPDGYVPRSDTVLQEIVLGKLYGWLAPEEVSLTAFVRRMTRLLNATAIFPVALLCFGLTRRRDAALVGALAWAVALPVAERGLGVVIFREDLAVPVLLWHLGFLALWARNPRVLSALLSGVFLAGSLLLWKVSGFYMLLLVGFLSTAHVLGREEPGRLLLGTIALLVPPGLACLLPLNLQHESFVTSTAMLAGVSVAVAMAGDLLVSRRAGAGVRSFKRRIVWLPAALLVFAGLRFALPSEVGYDHAWQTIVAKIRFLGAKPDDPGLLSFHARHYWTGNY
jgi:hypothetical protein